LSEFLFFFDKLSVSFNALLYSVSLIMPVSSICFNTMFLRFIAKSLLTSGEYFEGAFGMAETSEHSARVKSFTDLLKNILAADSTPYAPLPKYTWLRYSSSISSLV